MKKSFFERPLFILISFVVVLTGHALWSRHMAQVQFASVERIVTEERFPAAIRALVLRPVEPAAPAYGSLVLLLLTGTASMVGMNRLRRSSAGARVIRPIQIVAAVLCVPVLLSLVHAGGAKVLVGAAEAVLLGTLGLSYVLRAEAELKQSRS